MRHLYSLLEANYPRVSKILKKLDETNTDRKRLVDVFKEVFNIEPDIVLYSRAYKVIEINDNQFQYTIILSIRQGVCTKYNLYRYHEEWIIDRETVDEIELVKIVYIAFLGELKQPYTCKIKIKWKKKQELSVFDYTDTYTIPLRDTSTTSDIEWKYTHYYIKE